MAKASNSVPKKHRHKKVLAMAKGHYSVRHRHYRRAKESVMHALAYAYAHRRERKGDFRKLWILRIGAAARGHGISYSRLIHGLNAAGIEIAARCMAVRARGLDRKVFSPLRHGKAVVVTFCPAKGCLIRTLMENARGYW